MRLDAVGVGEHHAVAVGDDVVEMLRRRGGEPIDVIGRRRRKAVRDDDAVAISGKPVTGSAEDTEAFLAARQQLRSDRRRSVFASLARSTSPCATTCAGSGRADDPSGHNEVGA